MKELVQRFNSFISFSSPVAPDYINAKFDSTHRQNQIETLYWSAKGTRQQLISTYWFSNVIGHFVLILSLSILLTDLICGSLVFVNPGAILLVSLLSFPILLFFHYWPNYQSKFLPRLETAMELYEKAWEKHLEECRKGQFQGLTLTLLIYGLLKPNGIDLLQPTVESAELLNHLFGKDSGGMRKHLDLILGPSSARQKMNQRARTEAQNRFSEASELFQDWKFLAGVQALQELETRVLRS